jgi:hypothetical protein
VHRHARQRRAPSRGRTTGRESEEAALPRAASPTELGTLLRVAEGGTRGRVTSALQARLGNRGVSALVGARVHGLPAHVHPSFASELIETVSSMVFGPDDEDEVESELELTTEGPTTSGTDIVVNEETFDVAGDFVTMAHSIAAREEAGSVTGGVSDFYFYPLPGPIKVANVTVTETRSLPNWVQRGSPTPEQTAEWNRFRAAVVAHEQHHLDIDKGFFKDVHAKCIGVSETRATARLDQVDEAANTANKKFDQQTTYGQKPEPGTTIDTTV